MRSRVGDSREYASANFDVELVFLPTFRFSWPPWKGASAPPSNAIGASELTAVIWLDAVTRAAGAVR